MNEDQAPVWNIVNIYVKRQVVGFSNAVIATALEVTLMDTIQVKSGSVLSQKKPITDGLIIVLISEMIESGQLDFNMETWASSLADGSPSMDSFVSRVITQKNLILRVGCFLNNLVHN